MLFPLLLAFFAGFALVLGFWPVKLDNRPVLKLVPDDSLSGLTPPTKVENKKKEPIDYLLMVTSKIALFNKPIAVTPAGRRMYKDLVMAKSRLTVEEFLLIKEILIILAVILAFKLNGNSDFFTFSILMSFAAGYMLPELWLKARIKKVKEEILKYLPDTVDLLGLCVNAGLDFMMALKYVVEKSNPTVIIDELSPEGMLFVTWPKNMNYPTFPPFLGP